MKLLLICSALVIGALAVTEADFQQFMLDYERSYADEVEYQQRFEIFRHNVEEAERMTREANGRTTFGITQFSDWTREEFKTKATGLKAGVTARSCLTGGVTQVLDPNEPVDPAMPSSYNWTAHGVVTPVKNQGQCGSCWTFSTTGATESAYAIATGKLIGLSEQEIVDCSHGCTKEPPYGNVCNQGCNGGWPWAAMNDIILMGGLESEQEYPYTAVTDPTCSFKKSKVKVELSNYTCLTHPGETKGVDEHKMAEFMWRHGPLSIALDASPLMSYTGGVLSPQYCDATQLDHAVLVTGYGEQSGTPYWAVKNSWGAAWGMNGYFLIEKGVGACGLNTAVTLPIVKK